MERLHIAVVSSFDIADHASFSGVPHYVTTAIQRLAKVSIAAPLPPLATEATSAKRSYYKSLGKSFLSNRDDVLMRIRGDNANAWLNSLEHVDAVVVFHPPDAVYLHPRHRIILIHDATWKQFTESYPGYTKSEMASESYEAGYRLERLGFRNASHICFFTQWAADSAVLQHADIGHKLSVMAPGASWAELPSAAETHQILQARDTNSVHLLFIGAAAFRKGLDIALNTQWLLEQWEVPSRLDIVGADPSSLSRCSLEGTAAKLRWHGILRKNVNDQATKLRELTSQATLLLVPSRADCGSLAMCDAAAFGVPSISSGAGGISSLMTAWPLGINVGYAASPRRYAEVVTQLHQSPDQYFSIARSARNSVERGLNWDNFGEHIVSTAVKSASRGRNEKYTL